MNNHAIETIANEWETHERTWTMRPSTKVVVLGDFNCHHSTWESRLNAHLTSTDQLLNPLLNLIVNMHLEMVLPRDIPMLEARNTGNWTRPDNVWRCSDTPSPFISCNIIPSLCPANTDHLSIISKIDLAFLPSPHMERFNYKKVNWDTYATVLNSNINQMDGALTSPINSIEELEQATDQLFKAIDSTTREVIPLIKITPHTKRWWTNELSSLCISRNKASAEHSNALPRLRQE